MAEDQIDATTPAVAGQPGTPTALDPATAQAVAELEKLLPEPGIRRRVFSTLLRAATTVTDGGGR